MKHIKFILSLLAVFIFSCTREVAVSEKIDYPAAYVVNGEDASLSVIKLSTGEVTKTISMMNHGGSHSIMWPHHIYHYEGPDHHKLAVAVPGMDLSQGHAGGMTHGGKIAVLDGVSGEITSVVNLHKMNHNAIFTPDGSEIWTALMSHSGKVYIYDAVTLAAKDSIAVGKDPAEVTFSPNFTKAYVCNGGDNSVTVINPATKSVITTLQVGANPVGAWPSLIGKMFVDNEDGKSISVIDIASNSVVATIPLGFKPGIAAYDATSSELWVTDATNGKVVFFKNSGGDNWAKQGEIATGADAHGIGFYGTTAYVTNQGANTVSIIDVPTHSKKKDISVGKKPNGIVIRL